MRSATIRRLPPIPIISSTLTRTGLRRLPPTPNSATSTGSTSSSVASTSSTSVSRSVSAASSTTSIYCSEENVLLKPVDDSWCWDGPCRLVRRPHIRRRGRRRPRPLPPLPSRQSFSVVVQSSAPIGISRAHTYPRRKALPVPPSRLDPMMFPPVSPIENHSNRTSQVLLTLPFGFDEKMFEASLPKSGIDWDGILREMLVAAA